MGAKKWRGRFADCCIGTSLWFVLIYNTNVNTIPYLSENQVIIFTEGGGQKSADHGRPKKPVKILLK